MSEHIPTDSRPVDPTQLEVLPRYSFVGPHQEPELVQSITAYLENYSAVPPATELDKTPEQIALLRDIRGALTDYTRDLGVDVSSRLPADNKIHFYDDSELEKLRISLGKRKGWGGSSFPNGDTATGVPSGDNRQVRRRLHILNHELIHTLESEAVRISYREDGRNGINFARTSFAVESTDAFTLMCEITAEKMSRIIEEQYWPKYPRLQAIIDADPDYVQKAYDQEMDIVAEPMIERVAKKQRIEADEVWRRLALGSLTGDMKVLRQFADTFGTEGMRSIVHHNLAEPAGKLALKLGLWH